MHLSMELELPNPPKACLLPEKGGTFMSRKVGQIIARGERRWLVRVYLGRNRETRKRTYHNRTIPRCRGSPGHSGRILGSLAENGRET